MVRKGDRYLKKSPRKLILSSFTYRLHSFIFKIICMHQDVCHNGLNYNVFYELVFGEISAVM